MKKILIILLFISLSSISMAQMTQYSKYNKIEMEIFRNGELIGYNHYFFTKKGDEMIISNFLVLLLNKSLTNFSLLFCKVLELYEIN